MEESDSYVCMRQSPAAGNLSSVAAAPGLPAPPSVQAHQLQMPVHIVPAQAPLASMDLQTPSDISPDARVPLPFCQIHSVCKQVWHSGALQQSQRCFCSL